MTRRRRGESGFALLLIFLMGAILAITLYNEIPRVAFETQRQKEQLLVERGEQYKRAIQLFVRANKRWPAKIEDLESTNNMRFLRKRYKDPMTGKDEWRAIHINGNILTDSKVQTNQQKQEEKKGPLSTYLGEVAGLGQVTNLGAEAGRNNPGLQRRGSDNVGPGGPVPAGPNAPPGVNPAPGMANVNPNLPPGAFSPTGQPGIPNQPGGVPGGIVGQPGFGGPQGVPGQTAIPGVVGMPGLPGATPPGGAQSAANSGSSYLGGGSSYLGGGGATPVTPVAPQGGQPGVLQPGAFPPGTPVNSQTGGVSPVPYSTLQGANGQQGAFPQPGSTIDQSRQSAAAGLINDILTRPRPGGMPMANTNGMQVMGGGIAGFASTADQDSIMVYNDQTNYGLWEFIFDPQKQKLPVNVAGGAQIGTPAAQIGNQIGTPASQVGNPAGPGGSAFGAGGAVGVPTAAPAAPTAPASGSSYLGGGVSYLPQPVPPPTSTRR